MRSSNQRDGRNGRNSGTAATAPVALAKLQLLTAGLGHPVPSAWKKPHWMRLGSLQGPNAGPRAWLAHTICHTAGKCCLLTVFHLS